MFLFFLTSYIHQKVCLFNFLHPSLYFVAVTRSVSALGMGYRGGVDHNNDSDGSDGSRTAGTATARAAGMPTSVAVVAASKKTREYLVAIC